jgi:large subunit ribosomal protein L6
MWVAKLFVRYSKEIKMSRVGKHAVAIPQGVNCTLSQGVLEARGKNGNLKMTVSPEVTVEIKDAKVFVHPKSKAQISRMMWGTTQRLITNLVMGVHEGFTKRLEINGVGYRAQIQGNKLVMQLGYSHDIEIPVPSDIKIACEKPTSVSISGPDRQKVGELAAYIRKLRPPEPYKGKGVKYENEIIVRKEGKKK